MARAMIGQVPEGVRLYPITLTAWSGDQTHGVIWPFTADMAAAALVAPAASGGKPPEEVERCDLSACPYAGLAARLLLASTRAFLTRQVVARRAGLKCTGRTCEAFAWLVREGLLVSTADGVRRPGGTT